MQYSSMHNLISKIYIHSFFSPRLWPVALIICIGVFEGGFFLQTLNDFWFDDDATLFAFVAGVKSPFAFFLSHEVIAASGFSFTPMQMLSYWFNLKLGGTDPTIAYLHSFVIFILTAIMLFTVLRFSQSTRLSLIATIAWMFLPSTIAIQEFIGARHYMEGLFLTICSVFFCYKNHNTGKPFLRVWYVFLALVCLFLAMLCKEVFVTSGFFLILILFAFNKRYREATSVVVIGVLYACYRLWAIGFSSKYPMQPMEFSAYLDFLAKLPFIFCGNYMGYLLIGGILLCGLFLAVRRDFPYVVSFIFFIIVVISLITIYPGSSYLSNDWQSRGTWYRLPFLLNLIFLLGGCFLLKRVTRQFTGLMCLVLVVSLFHGASVTKNHWHVLKDRYAVTGKYYIKNKDKLVYSEVPAYWYLGGLKSLYRLKHPFILSHSPNKFKYGKIKHVTEVWRYQDGKMFADPELWIYLKDKYM